MESYSLLYSSSHRTGLLAGFQRLRSERRMCDVVLETGGASFPCHRALLASSSDYFWALFGDNMMERFAPSVSLPALTPDGLEAILDFLYSGWLSLSPSTLPVILEAARYLQVEAAVSICERFIADGLCANNCCCYANLAERHSLPNSLEAANHTIAMEMGTLLQENREGLLELNIQSLMAVLDADEIPGVKEVELIKLALDWLDANAPLPLLRSNLLLSRLRFGLVTTADLTTLSHAHRAMATPLVRSQLTRALEYHTLGSARPIRQSRQTSLRAPANRVLLVGGGATADCPEQQILTFDLRTRKFSSLASSLPRRLRKHCVCSVGGFLFVIGGEEVREGDEDGGKSVTVTTTNQVWRYDPRFECWEEAGSMQERRAQFACCVVEDVIYVIGGRHTNPETNTRTSVASVEFYDMASGTWRRGAAMPRPVYGHASAALGNGIYVSGGLHGNLLVANRVENQAGNQGVNQAGNQGVNQAGNQGVNQGGNQGGNPGGNQVRNQGGINQRGSREVLFWDPKGKVWEKRASMSIARFGHRMATAHGHIYALLGKYEPFCDIERYDSRVNHWTRLRPLLSGSFGYGLASTPSGSLLLFGGKKWNDGQEVTVKSVLQYDTARDRWREICQLPRPLSGTECTLLPLPD